LPDAFFEPAAKRGEIPGARRDKEVEGIGCRYDGTAVRKSVDNTLNKNDGHNQDLDKALKTGADR